MPRKTIAILDEELKAEIKAIHTIVATMDSSHYSELKDLHSSIQDLYSIYEKFDTRIRKCFDRLNEIRDKLGLSAVGKYTKIDERIQKSERVSDAQMETMKFDF